MKLTTFFAAIGFLIFGNHPLWADSTSLPVSFYLVDSTGAPLDGAKTITVRLYAAATGGSALWSEEQSITCDAGVCSTTLGENDTNPVDTIVFSNNQLFLTIQISGESESDSRVELSASPWSLYASVANVANSLASGVVTTTSIASEAITSSKIASGAVEATNLASSAVTSAKISDGTIATADLADSSVTAAKIDQSIAPSWTGTHSFATPPSMGLGGSSSTGKPVATASVNVTAVGNVGAGEDNLMTYTLPANALSSNGRGVRITAWGTAVDSGFGKILRCYFGSTQIIQNTDFSGLGASINWLVEGMVIRTGASAETSMTLETVTYGGGGSNVQNILSAAPAENLAASVTIKCTADATNDNDIQQTGMVVEVIN